ncbi:MAG: hypothetical protein PHF44_01255 [Candidatus Pacebacteria bacterium]|nr:hypothetical protein [Candidatus Paceibacterota bacterium]
MFNYLADEEGKPMKKFFKNQAGYLLYGFIFWLPIAIFIIIVWYAFANLEAIGGEIGHLFFPGKIIYPGVASLILLLIFLSTGYLLRKTPINKFFSKIPVLGLFFGEGQIMTFERLSHLTPCLFLYSPTCISYGWIISEEKIMISGENNHQVNLVNVYYPNIPTIITGQIFAAKKETVVRLSNSSKQIIDLLLYAFKSPDYIKYLPWPDEDKESFIKRAKNFGLNVCTE